MRSRCSTKTPLSSNRTSIETLREIYETRDRKTRALSKAVHIVSLTICMVLTTAFLNIRQLDEPLIIYTEQHNNYARSYNGKIPANTGIMTATIIEDVPDQAKYALQKEEPIQDPDSGKENSAASPSDAPAAIADKTEQNVPEDTGDTEKETTPIVNNETIPSETTAASLLIQEGVTDSFFSSTVAFYNLMPETVKARLNESGWKIHVTSNNISRMFGYPYAIMAMTEYYSYSTWIGTQDASAVIHECGHAYDFLTGWVSNTQEFYDIYASEVGSFAASFPTHPNNYGDVVEYWAESFSIYVMKPEQLNQVCPRTYNYIASHI